eukprot:767949-Hanusia_phi.AAC.4
MNIRSGHSSSAEPSGGSMAPTIAAYNRRPKEGGVSWSQSALVTIEENQAFANFGGGGQVCLLHAAPASCHVRSPRAMSRQFEELRSSRMCWYRANVKVLTGYRRIKFRINGKEVGGVIEVLILMGYELAESLDQVIPDDDEQALEVIRKVFISLIRSHDMAERRRKIPRNEEEGAIENQEIIEEERKRRWAEDEKEKLRIEEEAKQRRMEEEREKMRIERENMQKKLEEERAAIPIETTPADLILMDADETTEISAPNEIPETEIPGACFDQEV